MTVGRLSLVGVYSAPDRDPRGHVCSVAFLGRAKAGKAKAGSDALKVEWIKSWRKAELAFDHYRIVLDAVRKLSN